MDSLKLVEDRAFKTYKSRLKASERLTFLSRVWNACLISFATSTTIASIGLLSYGEMYGPAGDTYLAALAVISLVASLVVSGQGYAARSREMFMSYRKFQRISMQAELAQELPSKDQRARAKELLAEYDSALDDSENHTSVDFLRAFPTGSFRSRLKLLVAGFVLAVPSISFVVPVLVVIPFIGWAFRVSSG